MHRVRPLAAIRYSGVEISDRIAPPYDVLDDVGRQALVGQSEHNVVSIDLPHMPPKALGPDEAYAKAAQLMQQWLSAGVLKRDAAPALYPYSQRYTHEGHIHLRRGIMCLVRLSPFGDGWVVPHEKTYAGPIEDRLQLMRHTQAQLSPIFGLFSDPGAAVTDRIYNQLGDPIAQGKIENVEHAMYRIDDAAEVEAICAEISKSPAYIADGHHRYTTALALQKELETKNGGPLPEEHPANWCLFTLVAMQDPGLLIQPAHRLVGGLTGFDIETMQQRVGDAATITPVEMPVGDYLRASLPKADDHTFGIYDGMAKELYELKLTVSDVLRSTHAGASVPWRQLDVAILQHWLLEEIILPAFCPSGDIKRGFTPHADAVETMVDGAELQIGILLKATPLQALEDLGKSDELMPQKSTYFYPKLATGMVIAPLAARGGIPFRRQSPR